MEQAKALLKQYWGYAHFRPIQERIIAAVLEGRDVFAMLPTGAGKSLCYQIPALCSNGFALVVSPLISLIEDQVMRLNNIGIKAVFIHSGMPMVEVEDAYFRISNGEYKLVYISPERIQSLDFERFAYGMNVNLIAIDEAHCISQWGHDFRPSYRQIQDLRDFFPKVPMIALTASATSDVKSDIIAQLQLRNPKLFEQSIVRNNLFYHIKYSENKPNDCIKVFLKTPGPGILYCRSRRRTIETATHIQQNSHIPTHYYHAGISKAERRFLQQQWMQSHESVMTATTAFGMGIDKPDVRTVAHYDLPESLEQYYQEVGRAGRDGEMANGVLLYNNSDIHRLEQLPEVQFPPIPYIIEVYQKLCDYFQLPLDDGNGQIFPFDITHFCASFKTEVLPTINAIKLLEREGFLQWNEDASTQYTVQLTTNRDNIDYLEKNEPQLFEVVEVLLRHYGSVYNFETPIRIFDMSKKIGIDKTVFEQRLYQLESLGILRYKPAIIGSYIIWQHERYLSTALPLDISLYNTLKNAFTEKVRAMIAYILNNDTCRNILLSKYFGQKEEAECGGCDNCIRKTKNNTLPKPSTAPFKPYWKRKNR